jgi:hypothetical protein
LIWADVVLREPAPESYPFALGARLGDYGWTN